MLTGGTAIPGACIGIFLGGYILKKLQLQPQGAIKMVLIFNLLCMASYGLLFFLGCNNVAMAGATTSYSANSRWVNSKKIWSVKRTDLIVCTIITKKISQRLDWPRWWQV